MGFLLVVAHMAVQWYLRAKPITDGVLDIQTIGPGALALAYLIAEIARTSSLKRRMSSPSQCLIAIIQTVELGLLLFGTKPLFPTNEFREEFDTLQREGIELLQVTLILSYSALAVNSP